MSPLPRRIDIILEGNQPGNRSAAAERVRALAEVGATWWIESDWSTFSIEDMRRRIEAGPPVIE